MYSRLLFTLSPHRVNSERPGMGLVDSMQDTVLFGVENHGELCERGTCDGFCIYNHIHIYIIIYIYMCQSANRTSHLDGFLSFSAKLTCV